MIQRIQSAIDKYATAPACETFSEAESMAIEAAAMITRGCTEYPIHAADALKSLGFEVVRQEFDEPEISGVLLINGDKKRQRIVGVNSADNIGHQNFALAHELAHYIFDLSQLQQEHLEIYYKTKNSDIDLKEYRANQFAVNFLMPQDAFRIAVTSLKKQLKHTLPRLMALSRIFEVSETAVKRRLSELGLEI